LALSNADDECWRAIFVVSSQVSGEHVHPAPGADERRLRLGDYIADIVISTREEHCCYYVIQRAGSAEIIEVQRFENADEAKAAANSALKRWHEEEDLGGAHFLPPRMTR
jgi:hypothetical protein